MIFLLALLAAVTVTLLIQTMRVRFWQDIAESQEKEIDDLMNHIERYARIMCVDELGKEERR